MSNSHPNITSSVSLKPYNTFHIDVYADFLAEIHSPEDLYDVLSAGRFQSIPRYILGGGSNVLFPNNFHGLIIKNSIPGAKVLAEDDRFVTIRSGAGVVWDDLVRQCVDKGWGGIENLSMIPGQVGAAPIQNIGAYGVELKETFVSLEAINLKSGKTESFDRAMCRFGYRDSIFKTSHKGQYLITSVTLRLEKNPQLRLDYGNLRDVLSGEGISRPTLRDVSRAVRNIRSSKLPDPEETGNAGSFFKNPVIPEPFFKTLKETHPDIPGFPVVPDSGSTNAHDVVKKDERKSEVARKSDVKDGTKSKNGDDGLVKVPAAWLIEQCGFKGIRDGDAGVHDRHALILVNHGNATGKQLLGIANAIREKVESRFGIALEPEVNIVSDGSGEL